MHVKGPGFDPRHLHLIVFHYNIVVCRAVCLALSASRKGAREIHKQGLGRGGGGGECGRLRRGASMPVIALPAIFGDMRPSPDLSIVSYSFICGNKLMNQLYHLFMTTGVSQG